MGRRRRTRRVVVTDTLADNVFTYKYNEDHHFFMEEQIWECKNGMLDVYSRLSKFEHDQIKDHINHPKVVLDIGCGIGRAGIYLNVVFQDPGIHYIFADRTGHIGIKNWSSHGEAYYNDLDLTSSFAELNGVTNFRTFDTGKDDWDSLPKIDFVTSRCAAGMHFPIEDIMPNLLKATVDECTMIFGIRKNQPMIKNYSAQSFTDLFEEVVFLQQEQETPFPKQDWLILKNKI